MHMLVHVERFTQICMVLGVFISLSDSCMSVTLSPLPSACWHPTTTMKWPKWDRKLSMINLLLLLAEYLPKYLSVMIGLMSQRQCVDDLQIGFS